MDDSITVALTWCLAWGEGKNPPPVEIGKLNQIREDITKVDPETQTLVKQVQQLQNANEVVFPALITDLKEYAELWQQNTKIGLVYGGATKIKGYVFDSAKLPEVRGASAILDRINLVDLPAFFRGEESDRFPECQQASEYCRNLRNKLSQEEDSASQLFNALIPELIIYATGGNILAFCPAAFVDDLANLIEKQYTKETLTANSCAVGETFNLLEIRFGLLKDNIADTPWLGFYQQHKDNEIVKIYFKNQEITLDELENKKSFNEIAGKLATCFNQRRNGNNIYDRPSRRYPPMFETHPYLIRDTSDRVSAEAITKLPDEPKLSESLARKNFMGRKAKVEGNQPWFEHAGFDWKSGEIVSWVKKFEAYLADNPEQSEQYYQEKKSKEVKEALSLEEVGNNAKNFVAFIYADGNNMGGYIQTIKTPQEYMEFSRDIFEATEKSVYRALAEHLHPHELKNLIKLEADNRNGRIIHPFEIITIGGDDVLLIVPANKALEISHTIGVEFETILLSKGDKYKLEDSTAIAKSIDCHRYKGNKAKPSECKLSTSIGVLITSYNTPIYYADRLVEQLLKSAKKKAKSLKQNKNYQYHGGTVDFLVLKSVTMISSNINAFREEGLEQIRGKDKLKLYATPYTLQELAGLIDTAKALKQAEFPRSQLYQIRSLLERGKNTAMLNYRYFRVRLTPHENQKLLEENFEQAWCKPKDENNKGNLAPWMSILNENGKVSYETIWREIVDIYPFIETEDKQTADRQIQDISVGSEA
ncbi:MAG: type III-B CRISPR-associated protein Cas10/Cmr2 [Cyanobacteria bacterium P01_A01_bin.84]